MSVRDPIQVVVILDAEGSTPVEDVLARLPERDDPPRIYRLSEHGGGGLRRDRALVAADWTRQANAVKRLVEHARKVRPADGEEVEYYIWGQAPLPLFVQLGQEMSTWTFPLTLLGRRADGTWDELPVSGPPLRSVPAEQFFDVVTGLDGPSAQGENRPVGVFVSTRAPVDPDQIMRFMHEQGNGPGPLVEVRTRDFRLLDRSTAAGAAQELNQVFTVVVPRCYPQAPLALFVAGPTALAFLIGRALTPNKQPPGILVPHFERGEYRPALVLPWTPRGSKVLYEEELYSKPIAVEMEAGRSPDPVYVPTRWYREEVVGSAPTDLMGSGLPAAAERASEQYGDHSRAVVGPSPEMKADPGSVHSLLENMEQDLQALPRLRFTFDRRYQIWERLLDYLDRQHPPANLRKRIDAKPHKYFDKMRLHGLKLPEPAVYQPEDPLGAVLALLDQRSAARWLYLGAVEVQPTLAFPRGGNSQAEVELIERLVPYTDFLDSRQQRNLKQSQFLYTRGCPGLLAVLSRQHQESQDEVELAVGLLDDFRQDRPLPELWRGRDPAQVQGAAALNLIGAEALWRADLVAAERAYRSAQQRAEIDQNSLAEWVAVTGLIVTLRWSSETLYDAPVELEQRRSEEQVWQRRRGELEREPNVALIKEHSLDATLRTQRNLLDALHRGFVDATGPAAFGSDTSTLEAFLADQEEIGAPPMARGETAELLATNWLLLATPPQEPRLRQAVALLCRYGTRDEGERRFFSPALNPFRSDFYVICQDVLRPGRTVGEWLARMDYLDRYELDLPVSLGQDARRFYTAALELVTLEHDGSLPQLRGRSYGHVAVWSVLDRVVTQMVLLAGHLPDGLDVIISLLDSPEPRFWQSALEHLYLLAWRPWYALRELSSSSLESLAQKLVVLLSAPQSLPLFSVAREGRNGFYRENHISLGLAAILPVLRDAGIEESITERLHRDLCRLLDVGLQRQPELFQRVFFDRSVIDWLGSRTDNETQQFFERQVDQHLDRLEQFNTVSTYFIGLSCLGENPSILRAAQWDRLAELLQRHREQLLKAIAGLAYAVRPLLWLASGLTKQPIPVLKELGRELIQQSAPLSEGLVAAVASAPEELGSLTGTIERAVLHCLRGLASMPMPWFSAASQLKTREDSDELVRQGLGAVHNYLFFNPGTPPPGGWSRWLDPALAHCYNQNPRIAMRALQLLEQALAKVSDSVDLGWAVQALCWALARPHRGLRDEALFVAIRHQALLSKEDGITLSEALRRFEPPPSISSNWIARIAMLPVLQSESVPAKRTLTTAA